MRVALREGVFRQERSAGAGMLRVRTAGSEMNARGRAGGIKEAISTKTLNK